MIDSYSCNYLHLCINALHNRFISLQEIYFGKQFVIQNLNKKEFYLIGIEFARMVLEVLLSSKNQGKIKENNMAEENGTGSNLIWAITTIIIVAIIAGALYYSGFLGGTKKEKIDINVDVPATKSN